MNKGETLKRKTLTLIFALFLLVGPQGCQEQGLPGWLVKPGEVVKWVPIGDYCEVCNRLYDLGFDTNCPECKKPLKRAFYLMKFCQEREAAK